MEEYCLAEVNARLGLSKGLGVIRTISSGSIPGVATQETLS